MKFIQPGSRFGAAIRMPSPSIPEAEPIFYAGDTVMHPSEGVCTIAELRDMQLSGREMRKYYVLKPMTEKSSSTVYLPIARGNTLLRRLLTEEGIHQLIQDSRTYKGLWIADSKQRKDAFSAILSEGNYAKMICMIREIREESARREAEGKKPCASDEAIRAEAERLIQQEFSFVMKLTIEETVQMIMREPSDT
ncbi:MAG: CarD family transcriptional regulator [Clostridia bacterium]|nr:CarD family transcriptional regulator [Clostridia bacterium]